MPRAYRLIAILLLASLGLTALQPAIARASASNAIAAFEDFAQSAAPDRFQQAGAQPGPIVRQAFDLLMSRYVIPPKSGALLNSGLDAAHYYLESRYVADPLTERPPFTGNRAEDWRLFLPAYGKMRAALGDKGSSQTLDRVIVDGMARSFKEAHTYYLPPEAYQQQLAELQNQNQVVGIGIQMTPALVITDVFEGGPAEAAGIRIGDQIVGVDGESVENMEAVDVSPRIRGEAGTVVRMTVIRGAAAERIDIVMTRSPISIEWLQARILDGNIGYLQIRTFPIPDALPIFEQAMAKFVAADVRALIIDVRNNGGGAVVTGEEILSRFMPGGVPMYRQIDQRGERIATTWGDYWNRDIPIAVLTNGASGSMSEILAAALQENGVARIIGTKTAGAVAAGAPFPLADGSGLLVTVQMINTPNGRVINEVGLEPDQVVELDPALFRIGKDTQMDAALTYVREQVAARSRSGQPAMAEGVR